MSTQKSNVAGTNCLLFSYKKIMLKQRKWDWKLKILNLSKLGLENNTK